MLKINILSRLNKLPFVQPNIKIKIDFECINAKDIGQKLTFKFRVPADTDKLYGVFSYFGFESVKTGKFHVGTVKRDHKKNECTGTVDFPSPVLCSDHFRIIGVDRENKVIFVSNNIRLSLIKANVRAS